MSISYRNPSRLSLRDGGAKSGGPVKVPAMIRPHLIEIIKRLRAAEQTSFRGRHGRADFYDYLVRVYKVYMVWKNGKMPKTRADQVAALAGVKMRANSHPIRVLIDASSQGDVRAKSRRTQALLFANEMDISPEELSSFFEKNGGVAGFARKMASRRSTAKHKKKSHKPAVRWHQRRRSS
jgi:hypothetical protein